MSDQRDTVVMAACAPADGLVAAQRATAPNDAVASSRQLDGLEYVQPDQIEARSFQIISQELEAQGVLKERSFSPLELPVVKRVIHTTADFDYARNLHFTAHAVEQGVAALAAGATVVTDTTMVAAGINKRVLGRLGGTVRTFVADADVAQEARERGVTRSAVAMERAAQLEGPVIFALGNAPTALARVAHLLGEGQILTPQLVIGVPVGFVNVVESKELIRTAPVESIVARGRKGGSNVAAAIVNALLYLASDNRRD